MERRVASCKALYWHALLRHAHVHTRAHSLPLAAYAVVGVRLVPGGLSALWSCCQLLCDLRPALPLSGSVQPLEVGRDHRRCFTGGRLYVSLPLQTISPNHLPWQKAAPRKTQPSQSPSRKHRITKKYLPVTALNRGHTLAPSGSFKECACPGPTLEALV